MCVHESGMLERERERIESPVANISTTFITTFASSEWGKYVLSTPFCKGFLSLLLMERHLFTSLELTFRLTVQHIISV